MGAEAQSTTHPADVRQHELTVHHYGPDPAYVGGMGSVIRLLAEQSIGGDVVVAHSTWRPHSRLASLPLASMAAVNLLRLSRSDAVHVHLAEKGSFVREGALVWLGRMSSKVTVVTIHGAHFLAFARKHPKLTACVLGAAHVITCLDEDVCERARQLSPRAHVELIPNPVEIDHNSAPADQTGEIVLFAGEIGLRKGVDVLCRAWPVVAEARPQATCVIVGPTKNFTVPDLERLQARPSVDAAEMKELLRSTRVVALPSRAEGMPMILTEAMGAGRPFVSTPVGGIPELAKPGGRLTPVDDHVDLAKQLIGFLSDPSFAREVGERGRQFCTTTRSPEVVGRRLREIYLSAIEAR